MRRALIAFCLCLALTTTLALAAEPTRLLRQPALSANHLAFVYAGDIWVAELDGSHPRRLTTHPATERDPFFSPDGSMIAFRAGYEGNNDVYVIPTEGGQPKRLTWHPGTDIPTGWMPDGSAVTMASYRESDHGRSGHLYAVSLEGGLPAKQMEARFYRGQLDESGNRLAYISHGAGYNGLFGGGSGWKGYGGGTAPEIRILDMRRQTAETLEGNGSTNFNAFWLGKDLYFLSDREDKLFNLYRYDNGTVSRVTDERIWDVRSAAGHDDTVVYEAGGRLWSHDLGSNDTREIVVSIRPDLPQLRPQRKDASGTIQDIGLSPTGKRAVVTARGDVFTVPIEDGSTRNLTATDGRREYTALWSPDGKQIAYLVESLEGQTLAVVDQRGEEPARTFEIGPHFYSLLAWASGEPGRIVYQDNHLGLHVIDLESGRSTTIATGARRETFDVSISTDGRWLAFALEKPNYHRDLMLYELETGKTTRVSDGMADVASPAFSRDGKYLYFAASTNSGPLQVGLNMTSRERPYRAGLYAAVLKSDGKSPLLPERGDEGEEETDEKKADEETAETDGKDGGKKGDAEMDDSKKDDAKSEESKEGEGKDDASSTPATEIDLDGLAERIVGLPVGERNYGSLEVAKDGRLYYVQYVQPGATNEPPGQQASAGNALMRFDFEKLEASTVLESVNGFAISENGEHILIQKANGSLLASKLGEALEPEPLDLGGVQMQIAPRAEWGLIFDEVWRMEWEYFYAPNFHGLDWQKIYDRYRPLVEHVGRREDLNELMVEMIAEMHVGHNRLGGGDQHQEDHVATGLLGANLTIDNDRYKIARIYSGESWNPFLEAPLATPGNEAREGEYILAINGRDLTAADNIYAHLQGTTGEQVSLTVGETPDGQESREIIVEPVGSESALRLWSWIERNRRFVEEKTGGKVGYIYLPNTAGAGYTFFNRMFFAQIDKEAMIIDERSNAGGQAANYILEVLSRKHLSGWADRDGLPFDTPAGAIHGPKVMLIDQDAGSGGDYLPWAFRHLGIGPLIGTRTWGGLIGISANPRLTDGGGLSVPFFRFFDPDMNWSVENEGVAPDIEVDLDPIKANQGRDSQLEAAIDEVMARMKKYRPTVPQKAPPLPKELGE